MHMHCTCTAHDVCIVWLCMVMWGAGSLRQWQRNIHGDQLRPRRPPSNFYNAPRQSESKCVLCVIQDVCTRSSKFDNEARQSLVKCTWLSIKGSTGCLKEVVQVNIQNILSIDTIKSGFGTPWYSAAPTSTHMMLEAVVRRSSSKPRQPSRRESHQLQPALPPSHLLSSP